MPFRGKARRIMKIVLCFAGDIFLINGVFFVQVKKDFAFSLFDLDWDVFLQHVEGACRRVPAISETGVKSTVSGPGMCGLCFKL